MLARLNPRDDLRVDCARCTQQLAKVAGIPGPEPRRELTIPEACKPGGDGVLAWASKKDRKAVVAGFTFRRRRPVILRRPTLDDPDALPTHIFRPGWFLYDFPALIRCPRCTTQNTLMADSLRVMDAATRAARLAPSVEAALAHFRGRAQHRKG